MQLFITKLFLYILCLFPFIVKGQECTINDRITLIRATSIRFEAMSVANGKTAYTGEGRADSNVALKIAGNDITCEYALFGPNELTAYNVTITNHSDSFPCEIKSRLLKFDLDENIAVLDGNVSFCNAAGVPLSGREVIIDFAKLSYKLTYSRE